MVQYTGGQTGLEESSVSDEQPEFAQCHHDGVACQLLQRNVVTDTNSLEENLSALISYAKRIVG
jgi:hypothetical protein